MAFIKITEDDDLESGAAGSYKRARKAGLPAGVTSARRTRAQQQHLYDLYKAGKGNYATPPNISPHVKGLALDLPGRETDVKTPKGWMKKYGAKHGWVQASNEDWHFDYVPARDKVLIAQRAAAAERARKRAAARVTMKRIQMILGVVADGDPGPKTKAAWDKLTAAAK